MPKINLKIRKENIVFIAQIAAAVISPILAYAGITAAEITSWPLLGKLLIDAVKNPYVLLLIGYSVWTALTNPTTPGFFDDSETLIKKSLRGAKGE